MRLIAGVLFGIFGALAPASFAAYDFSFSTLPGSFTYSRDASDDGVIIDHLRGVFSIPSTPVESNTYSFHVAFPTGTSITFSQQIDRIDLLAALGDIQTGFGVHGSAGLNKASAVWAVQNLSITSLSGDTVTFFAPDSFTTVVGTGFEKFVSVGSSTITPGNPFRLTSLDVTFTIPSQQVPSSVPPSPASTFVLDVAGAKFAPASDANSLPPLAQAVPEPGAAAVALGVAALLVTRRETRR